MQEYSDDISAVNGAAGRGATVKMITASDVKKLEQRSDIEQVVPIYQLSAKYVTFEGNNKKWVAPLAYYDASTVSEAAAGTVPALGRQIADGDILVPKDFTSFRACRVPARPCCLRS